MIKIFFVLFVLFSLLACEKKEAYSRELVLAYAELRIAGQEYGETETGKAVRLQILQKHELSAEIFEEKITEIKEKPEIWFNFQKTLIAILDSIAGSNKEIKEEN